MLRFRLIFVFALLAASAFVTLGRPKAAPPTYTSLYVFGDSSADMGNAFSISGRVAPVSPPYAAGRYSNGRVWVEYLAEALGVPSPQPSRHGGTNYAVGGAQTGSTRFHAATEIDLPTQLDNFLASGAAPDDGALFVLAIGGNDVMDIATHARGQTWASLEAALRQVAQNQADFLASIARAGARRLVVTNLADPSLAPHIRVQGPAVQHIAQVVAARYNAILADLLGDGSRPDGLSITLVDLATQETAIVADPARYGFTDVITPCWSGTPGSTEGTLCSADRPTQNKHLFWDATHPTTAGHSQIARTAERALGVAN